MSNKRTMGLIRQEQIIPETTADRVSASNDKAKKKERLTTEGTNQQSNIKTSLHVKEQLELLMKFTDQQFLYEVVETLLDYYVDNALDPDERRSFLTLSNLIRR